MHAVINSQKVLASSYVPDITPLSRMYLHNYKNNITGASDLASLFYTQGVIVGLHAFMHKVHVTTESIPKTKNSQFGLWLASIHFI